MISWPGNKRRQLRHLIAFVPDVPKQAGVCEPFFGAGCFTLEMIERGCDGPVYAAEACRPLWGWWMNMMSQPEDMIELMSEVRCEYAEASISRYVFDDLRDNWNESWEYDGFSAENAAMLWVLIYQSTNNLARFNQKGKYNQTWGCGRRVPDPHRVFGEREIALLHKLKVATDAGCFALDFREALGKALDAEGDFLYYLDPPYILETGTYKTDCWGRPQLDTLIQWVEELEQNWHWWLWTDYLSNGREHHPYEASIRAHYRIYPLPRGKDSRPNGTADAKEEVIIAGMTVGEPKEERSLCLDL